MNQDNKIAIQSATLADYPVIQNMARFYVYDRTIYMGWPCPENGLFDCIDFKHYFENPDEKAFLIHVDDELAGFVLLDKEQLMEPAAWNMGEFFIVAKFQGKGIAEYVALEIFKKHPGKWSVAVMPENLRAVAFWRKVICKISQEDYTEVFKTADELKTPHNSDPYAMILFHFVVSDDKNILMSPKESIHNGIYQHYKTKQYYQLIDIGQHTETDEEMVIYKALYDYPECGYGKIWIRPKKLFFETISYKGELMPRFTLIENNEGIKNE